MRSRLLSLAACALLAACGSVQPNNPAAEKRGAAAERAQAQRLRRACGSQDSYERLKALAFDEAARVRRAPSPALKRLASLSVVRMERPVVRSRDEALSVTVCQGRLVLELPPGAEDVFDGDRRLVADVEYSAQEAADGSGLVFQMEGAEPIVYRLAAFDLPSRAGPAPEPTGPASAEPAPTPPVGPEPTAAVPPTVARLESAPERPTARPRPAPEKPAAEPNPKPSARPKAAPRPAARSTPETTSTTRPVRPTPRPTARATPRAVPTVRIAARPSPRPSLEARPSPRPTPTVRAAPRPAPTVRPAPRAAPTARARVRPSFPCDYARSRVERLVCEDPRLARADRAMSAAFGRAVAEGDGETRRALRISRDRFLRFRDRCPDAECVLQAYDDRIAEIRDIAAGDY